MIGKIDYKRLWRKTIRQIVTLTNKDIVSQEIIGIQGDIIKQLNRRSFESNKNNEKK